ncbi:MAG: FAD-dependent oxidoreductase, partial [Candidatus Bathyarchaeota archaeon]|nr:FAD-dependent oxidoreductase [Candidatus Bathyarchaeota archaeon]
MKSITEREKRTPVAEEAEVIVAGAGIAGVAAAVASARSGAKTLLVERNGLLGGVATAGLMASMGNKFFANGELVIRGIALEILERLVQMGGTSAGWKSPLTPKIPFDPEVFSLVLLEMVKEANVGLYLHTMAVETIMSEDCL